ncbi:hypothetical protein [Photobacterium leiognathi]|uniref:hypothetical protein n=1 Tax=Photobacterium leiognathi TaxID=553611 RepID=UPI00273A38F9|nr:hypothetical protein [Photobacterium leiognathi]
MTPRSLKLNKYGLESLIRRSQKWLHDYEPQRVWYPKELYSWNKSIEEAMPYYKKAFESNRNSFIKDDAHRNNNIYAIWCESRPYSKEWDLKYIGQRHSSGIKERLKNHLFGAPFGEGPKPTSKFYVLHETLQMNKMIYVSYVKVEPEPLRTFIEHSLICVNKKLGYNMWNSHGAANVDNDINELDSYGLNVSKLIKT